MDHNLKRLLVLIAIVVVLYLMSLGVGRLNHGDKESGPPQEIPAATKAWLDNLEPALSSLSALFGGDRVDVKSLYCREEDRPSNVEHQRKLVERVDRNFIVPQDRQGQQTCVIEIPPSEKEYRKIELVTSDTTHDVYLVANLRDKAEMERWSETCIQGPTGRQVSRVGGEQAMKLANRPSITIPNAMLFPHIQPADGGKAVATPDRLQLEVDYRPHDASDEFECRQKHSSKDDKQEERKPLSIAVLRGGGTLTLTVDCRQCPDNKMPCDRPCVANPPYNVRVKLQ